jgi:3-methyladenine DNA glycosylase/8-oxoguanine DNA glycosylase
MMILHKPTMWQVGLVRRAASNDLTLRSVKNVNRAASQMLATSHRGLLYQPWKILAKALVEQTVEVSINYHVWGSMCSVEKNKAPMLGTSPVCRSGAITLKFLRGW